MNANELIHKKTGIVYKLKDKFSMHEIIDLPSDMDIPTFKYSSHQIDFTMETEQLVRYTTFGVIQ